MRRYARNSPEAAARIVALVLIADGHVCRSEVEAMQRIEIEAQLGLGTGGFARLMHTLCEDLLLMSYGGGTLISGVDATTLDAWMADIDDPDLQRRVLRLAMAAAAADRHLADSEAAVLAAARRCWHLDGQTLDDQDSEATRAEAAAETMR